MVGLFTRLFGKASAQRKPPPSRNAAGDYQSLLSTVLRGDRHQAVEGIRESAPHVTQMLAASADALPVLVQLYPEADSRVQERIVDILHRGRELYRDEGLADRVASVLIEVLDARRPDGDPRLVYPARKGLVEALCMVPGPASTRGLLRLVYDGLAGDVSIAASELVGRMSELENADDRIRCAYDANRYDLIASEGAAALPFLMQSVNVNVSEIPELLGAIGGDSATLVLLARLDDYLHSGSNNPGARGVVAGLGKTKDPRAVTGLLRAAHDGYLAETAASALQCLLVEAATQFETDDLRKIQAIGELSQGYWESAGLYDSNFFTRAVATDSLVDLAETELRRRSARS